MFFIWKRRLDNIISIHFYFVDLNNIMFNLTFPTIVQLNWSGYHSGGTCVIQKYCFKKHYRTSSTEIIPNWKFWNVSSLHKDEFRTLADWDDIFNTANAIWREVEHGISCDNLVHHNTSGGGGGVEGAAVYPRWWHQQC